MIRELRIATLIFLLLTVVTGVVYPALVTVVAQLAFPDQAGGSLVRVDGKLVGSRLIGQPFSSPKYFWGRPSATGPMPNNGAVSSGSNLGPLNPALTTAVQGRDRCTAGGRSGQHETRAGGSRDRVRQRTRSADLHRGRRIPGAPGGARAWPAGGEGPATGARRDAGRTFGVLGEPRVNVLELNLALDAGR